MTNKEILEFMEKELSKTEHAMEHAMAKPNVSSVEVANIARKIEIYTEVVCCYRMADIFHKMCIDSIEGKFAMTPGTDLNDIDAPGVYEVAYGREETNE